MSKGTYGHNAVRALLCIGIAIFGCISYLAWSKVTAQIKDVPLQSPVPIQPVGNKAVEHKAVLMSLEPAEPLRVLIPKLKLSAAVEKAGIDEEGEMAMPTTREVVSWFKQGYLPGALGNSVLAGHSIHTQGKGAFHDIHTLAIGDEIKIDTTSRVITFRVTHAKTVHADATDLSEVFGPSSKARLNLITCTGAWDTAKKRFHDRLIVFSEFDHEHVKS